jgi:two-component system cell cycle sensor histidine kinase/response regulator CckA
VKQPVSDEAREAAHDLNNLLTAIIGATDAVLERSGIDPETRADMAHVREGACRGAALVRRLGAGDPEPPGIVSVNATIRATSRLLAHRLGAEVSLDLDLAEADGGVRVDPAQLDRVLLNLIANARHAMPAGGAVTLRSARQVISIKEHRTPDTIPAGDYMVVAVTDTGCGMPAGQLPLIFAPGVSFRRGAGGSGLGLASVREIVRQAGGFIAVASVEGNGTCFEIYLPWLEAAPGSPVAAEAPATSGGRMVLLVDDDRLVRQVTERMLRRAGWRVVCSDSAEAALAVLESSHCDLLISDVAMPGMDGVALMRLVLARQPVLPVILMSGYQRVAMDDISQIASVTFLAKPYGQTDLLAAVARIAPAGEVVGLPIAG